jgi:hypothetical protein
MYFSFIRNSTDRNLSWNLVITYLVKKVPIFYWTQGTISVLKGATCWIIPVETFILQPSTICNIQICAPIYFINFWPPIIIIIIIIIILLLLLLYALVCGNDHDVYWHAIFSEDTNLSACELKFDVRIFSNFEVD